MPNCGLEARTTRTKDDTQFYFKVWGPKDAQPIDFHHGWPPSTDDWDAHIPFFGSLAVRLGSRRFADLVVFALELEAPRGAARHESDRGAQVALG